MHRLWLLLVIVGCSAPAKPVATEMTGVPARPITTKQAEPTPVRPPEKVPVTEATPKTVCEQDASSSECKCSQGVADSCFRLSDSEMRRGDHDSAIARVLGMCQQGTSQACFIGAKYLKRLHLEVRLGTSAKDLNARAIKLYEEKCSANDQAICVEYARLLLAGKYIAADAKRGRQLVEKACEAKNARACLTLGNMYASGQGVKKDRKRAVVLLDQACTASGGAACTALAEQLPASERTRIVELLTRGCADDDADACARVGALIDGAGSDATLTAVAAPLLMKACELDELKSCVRAGELAKATEPERARAAFERGCDGEVFAACLGLAPMVATGAGGPRNFGEGVALADKVCKLKAPKIPKACDVLAQLRRSPPDVTCTTIESCRPFCEEKLPKACIAMADLYMKADPEFGCLTARDSFADACEGSDLASCVKRGNASDTPEDAQRWYETACAAKHPRACAMRDAAAANQFVDRDARKAPIKSLESACRGRDQLACTWFADELGFDKAAAARTLWEAACTAGEGRACRRLAAALPMPGIIGVGDGSSQPLDPKIVKAEARARELLEKGCKLGDTRSCSELMDQRGDSGERPHPRCGVDLAWERVRH